MHHLSFFAVTLVLGTLASAQTTIRVPADYSTIQSAIVASTAGDTVLVAAGTYLEQIDFLGKEITVRSEAGPLATTIDSQGAGIWPDVPAYAVVRMINGEGPSTLLEGFEITGANCVMGTFGCGVWCVGLSPEIVNCHIVDNQGGAGVFGDATIEDCVITGNQNVPYADGGGVRGNVTIRRSTISGNRSGGLGGGVAIPYTGTGLIEDCRIQNNIAGNGFDGYSGGGVWGPATLRRCVITGNTAHHWQSGGALDPIGSGVDGAVLVDRCTIANNLVANSTTFDHPGGGVKDVAVIVNSILWGNEDAEFAVGTAPPVTYSVVQGGYPGTGNVSGDPLFRNVGADDYFLQLGSSAIDAGDPSEPLDPDGTRADCGALWFPQYPATLTVRNGSGVNPVAYTSAMNPGLATTWIATVDATAHGFPGTVTMIGIYSGSWSGVVFPFGELLIDPGSILWGTPSAVPIGGLATHSIPLPTDYALGGLRAYTQAVVLGGGLGVTNALDLQLGL